MRTLVHSFFGDNNLVLFHFWRREAVVKREKVYKCFVQDCLKVFLLVFTFLKMHRNSKNYQFLLEMRKPFYKYCPVAVGVPNL